MKLLKYMKLHAWEAFQIILFLGSFVILCIFFSLRIDNILDSDIASQLVMSKLLSEEKRLISPNWHNSTEIRAFSYQLVFVPLFWLTNNWQVVRIAGTVILYLIMLCGLFCLCCQLGIRKSFFSVGTIFVLPFSHQYFSYVLTNINYIIPITISFFAVAFCIYFVKCRQKNIQIIIVILGGTLACLAGMNGIRSSFVTYLPLFLAGAIMFFWGQTRQELFDRSKHTDTYLRLFVFNTWTMICSFLGYLTNKGILSKLVTFKDYAGSTKWDKISFLDIEKVLSGWLTNLGYVENESLFSGALFHNTVSVLLFFFTIYILIKVMRNTENFSVKLQLLSLYFICACGLSVLLFGFTTQYYQERFDLPVIVFIFPLIFLFIEESRLNSIKKRVISFAVIIFILISSILFYDDFSSANGTRELKEVVTILKENGYNYGYGTFWNGNVLTELSNGEIEVHVWQNNLNIDLKTVEQTFKWESLVEHDTKCPSGKVFWILTNEENQLFTIAKQAGKDYLIYQNDKYYIYGFDSYEEMVSVITVYDYNVDFSDYEFLSDGEDSEGVRKLFGNGVSAGPQIALYPGEYKVTCIGSNLQDVRFEGVGLLDEKYIELEMYSIEQTDNRISYKIIVERAVGLFETKFYNNTEEEIVLHSIRIEKVE